MDQPGDIAQLLVEIRDSQRAQADDIRKIREFYDHAGRVQKRLMFVALGLLLGSVALIAIISEYGDTTRESQNQQYQKQLDKADENINRTEKVSERIEKLQQRWDKQADRFDTLLEKWEKAAPKE